MKKLFLGLAVIAGAFTYAQETTTTTVAVMSTLKEKEPVRFGIKGAANASQFSEQQLNTKNQKLGFNAGVFVNIPLSTKFALQPEVLYNQIGAKSVLSSSEVQTGNTTVKTEQNVSTTLNYISVPLMVHFRPTENFYFEAGPEFSYFIDGKDKGESIVSSTTNGTTSTQIQSASRDIDKDAIQRFNFGLGLGLGYYFTDHLGINARYVNSLTHIYKDTPVGQNPNTNRVFQLGLNYKF
ncbi:MULTISPECIES: porin family protein [Chryseobacterium]|uniref:Opacity protein-like surface antigen n=1 Tax=Chryseobacterium camelliae TaxID=1265445 RepID=A0ABU0TGU3_9FLAO|nr:MULTISPECIES: porin family protein [Chryseobacterium]MDT3405918.1 opacity protein-like surface antigen [Pseudacidovorax intermedius]MDQ1096277.1 opacity protein-like surface antigen [Chryseobacterium camelliae]MDQ1100214.1 opacity protein-like surface antigen [Chryseobacterium sp. SORGH_AS_1048]MDR6087559.1 opacity protein-like surface antigen [Chryseobacterium sp. SORGH_AS_0909]MDR6131933.1 opacity protein-like surface antigen [Chryseobacterium sp. SORGH_AS_1175]